MKQCNCGLPAHKGSRCHECFNRAHRENQAARRAKVQKRCQCGAFIGAQATKCRECNMSALGSATAQRRAGKPEPVGRPAAAAWPGLRGPGGEREHGVTSVQGWATLDGGRV